MCVSQYIALLILIFILELSAGIAGYVCRDAAEEVLTSKLTESMVNYGKQNETVVTALWDVIQRNVSALAWLVRALSGSRPNC